MTKKSFLQTLCICLTSVGMPLFGQGVIPAVDLSTSSSYSFASFDADVIAGWEFTVNSPIALTDLGLYSGELGLGAAPAPTSALVRMWDSSGTLIASANVLDSDVQISGFTYHEIPSVLLEGGDNYIVALTVPANTGFAVDTSGETVPPELSYVAPRFTINTSSVPPTQNLLYLGGGNYGSGGYFVASFEFTTIPEPSTFVLAGLGLTTLVIGRQRLKS